MKRRVVKKTLRKQYIKWASVVISTLKSGKDLTLCPECIIKMDDAFWNYKNFMAGIDVRREVKSDINLKWGKQPR